MSQRYVVIDLETTGNSPKKGDRIIQFAGTAIENGKIVDEYSTFIYPEQDIPVFIEELTGINNEMVKSAPVFEAVAPKIADFLEDSCFVAHNVLFDLSFLQEELKRCGFEGFYGSTIDTVELAKIVKPTSDSYKLNQLARDANLEHDRPHRADSDAYVTALLFIELKKRLQLLPLITLKQLYKLSFSLKSEISELLDVLISQKLTRSEVRRLDIETFRGLALKKVNRIDTYRENPSPRFPENHEERLKGIRRTKPEMEYREGQLKMMDTVYESFQESRDSMIEAGTGIGKSLGYLFPAAYFAKETHKTVVVSTYTIQLQEQLLQKEVPKLKEMLPFPIHVVLLKGRGNYLSLAKFERALRQKDDNYETALTKMQILVWLTETDTGDRDELNLTSGGLLFWERLQSDDHTYPGLLQPWSGADFYQRARRVAETADIIVTNHAYLMADLLSKDRLIPSEGYMILDEAHHLEQAASKYLGTRFDYVSVKTQLNRLGAYDQKQLLFRLEKMVREKKLEHVRPISVLEQSLNDFMYEFEQLFYMLAGKAEKHVKNEGPKAMAIKVKENGEWKQVTILAERLIEHLFLLAEGLAERVSALNQLDLGRNALFFLNELELLIVHIDELRLTLEEFFVHPSNYAVYWLNYIPSAPHHGLSLSSQPVSAASLIWETFFAAQKSVVMTSATLSVKKSFRFFKRLLGIENLDIKSEIFPSPFDFAKNMRAFVSSEMPEVNSISLEGFTDAASAHLIAIAKAARGRTMILFTSHDMLQRTHHKVKKSGLLEEYTILAQGITGGSKMKLLRNFQSFDKALLFGTTSLWEGVDIPGERLSCLVIVRLPFSPPDEPVTEAKCSLLEKQGRNPFTEHSLPEAVLRFRQGFGRLIRTDRDKGVLIVLDRRITASRYGKEFISAIPQIQWEEIGLNKMKEKIKDWI
ncbi:ATP-dependent helicase DinG [Peribacillus cavernae]|uniref:3'-5' exonuclease DinG n=1 Tax=Peribacillus cavernae TaxID=1674310 RepID=A0A3S0VND2_9BACI|nr:ATP-dependent DNA helicase DinG [Peribacillus cavernae]MDQ0218960.1 ATP-dependent DNA helicase DinG [Peribacillus cavernae]RUQ29332.1 ATP-dependent helicase DinG [Peribacillus cavernae]